jgi:hypothetical protein
MDTKIRPVIAIIYCKISTGVLLNIQKEDISGAINITSDTFIVLTSLAVVLYSAIGTALPVAIGTL